MRRFGCWTSTWLIIFGLGAVGVRDDEKNERVIMAVGAGGKAVRPPDVACLTIYVLGNGILTVDAASA